MSALKIGTRIRIVQCDSPTVLLVGDEGIVIGYGCETALGFRDYLLAIDGHPCMKFGLDGHQIEPIVPPAEWSWDRVRELTDLREGPKRAGVAA